MLNIVVDAAANKDFDDAYDRYVSLSPETAARFVTAVRQTRDGIIRFPELAPMCDEQHRYANVKKFPYDLIYQVEPNVIRVVAITHSRQSPGF